MKVRIFTLAKDLNIDSKDLIQACAEVGLHVKSSPLASISEEECEIVLAHLKSRKKGLSDTSRTPVIAREVAPERRITKAIRTVGAIDPRNGSREYQLAAAKNTVEDGSRKSGDSPSPVQLTQPPPNQNDKTDFIDRIYSIGHIGPISAVAFNASGTLAFSGSEDTTTRVWEVSSGCCVKVLTGHAKSITSLAVSSNGLIAVTGSNDNTVRIWNVSTGACLHILKGHQGCVRGVAISNDGFYVFSGSEDSTIRKWDVASGQCLQILQGHTDFVVSVSVSVNGSRLVSGSSDKTVRVWNTESGRCEAVLKGHGSSVRSVAITDDGLYAFSASADNTVRKWDLAIGHCLHTLEGHGRFVLSVSISSDGQYVLSGSEDRTLRLWDLASGVCLRVLKGHTNSVLAVSFCRERVLAISGGEDRTLRIWDVSCGICLQKMEGHTAPINDMAFSTGGAVAVSSSADNTIRIWRLSDGACLRVIEGQDTGIRSVAIDAHGSLALSGSTNGRLRLWDLEKGECVRAIRLDSGIGHIALRVDGKLGLSISEPFWPGRGDDNSVCVWNLDNGQCMHRLKGHSNQVLSLALCGDGVHAISGDSDGIVRVWNISDGVCVLAFSCGRSRVVCVALDEKCRIAVIGTGDNAVRVNEVVGGRCLHILEGHTRPVTCLSLSSDGKYAFSGSNDATVRIWDLVGGRCLCVLGGHVSSVQNVTLSGDERVLYSTESACVVRAWDWRSLLPSFHEITSSRQTQYRNAKVLLVGDTGVGKSGIASRLIHREFLEKKSSHSRQAYVLESGEENVNGMIVHQESVLWDLAGQPAFRLVHQLSMDDAAVACVLFDNRVNPFESPAYWSQVLDQARTNTPVKKLLVASRIDVGGLPSSRERIESFAKEYGFLKVIETSAYTGEGCDDLLEAIRSIIPWEQLPTVTTDGPLAPLRRYIARLKGISSDEEASASCSARLLTVAELYEGFSTDHGTKIPTDEFTSYLKRLENTDAIDLLVYHTTDAEPQSDSLVLLDPTRVDAYASALLVAAKDEPDGPGHLLESRIREGKFRLADEERLEDRDAEKHVLWFVLENLLDRDLALREKIQGEDYIVFPSQCTAELTFPGIATFGVALGFAGPVRSIYATLIAQLAHYEGFQKREFFHDAAVYYPEPGGQCIIRYRDQGRGRAELELSFDAKTAVNVRQGFIEFVIDHLDSRSTPGSLTRRHAIYCPSCHEPFEDKVVKSRLETGKSDLTCPFCDEKSPLLNLLAPTNAIVEQVVSDIGRDAKAGRKRMTAALVIQAKKVEGKYDVFLSHNSQDKGAVEAIARKLLSVGIRPWLDKWDLAPGDKITDALEYAINTVPCAALCFGPADVGKWHIMEIRAYIEKWAAGTARMIPVILPGVAEIPDLPIFVRQTLWADLRNWEAKKDEGFYRLICGILGKSPGESAPGRFGASDIARWQGLDELD